MTSAHGRAFEVVVAKWLRSQREHQGITQDTVGAALGKSRPAVTLIEGGRQRLGVGDLYEYARLLNYPVSYCIEQALQPPAPTDRLHA